MFARAVTAVGAAGLTTACCWSLHTNVLEETGPSLICNYLAQHTKPALQAKLADDDVTNVRINASHRNHAFPE